MVEDEANLVFGEEAADITKENAFAAPEAVKADESGQKARWYLVHTYSGFEQRVQKTINEMRRKGEDKGTIEQVIVPIEKVQEPSKDRPEPRTTTRKLYPGYIMVRMVMTKFSLYLVQNIPKVTGFVGGKNKPAPMKDEDAQRVLNVMERSKEKPRPKFNFVLGDDVRVLEGPFKDFNGVVEEVNPEKGKLRVMVSVFGRQTPVELDFKYVSKS